MISQKKAANNPKKVSVFLTDECNLYCRHCYLGQAQKRHNFLNWKEIKTTLEEFKNKGYQLVEFTGGEAYLSPCLEKSVKYANKLGFKTIGIDTNGTHPKLIEMFSVNQVDQFTFSVDGASPETHDYIRGDGCFKKTLNTLIKAVKKGFRVECVCSVYQRNLHEIKELVKRLDQLGVSRLSFNYISFIGNARNNKSLVLRPHEWIELRKKVESINNLEGLTLRFPVMFVSEDNAKKYRCPIPKSPKTYVYANKRIHRCCLFSSCPRLASGLVKNTKVVWPEKEAKLVKEYQNYPCPAQKKLIKTTGYPEVGSTLVPVCIYEKIIIKPKKG